MNSLSQIPAPAKENRMSVTELFLVLIHSLPTIAFKPEWSEGGDFYDKALKDTSIKTPCKAIAYKNRVVILLPQTEGFNVVVFSRFIDSQLRICFQSRPQVIDDSLEAWKRQLAAGLPVGGVMDDEQGNFDILVRALVGEPEVEAVVA